MKNKKSEESLTWQYIAIVVISLLVLLAILFGFPSIAEGYDKAIKFFRGI